MKRKVAERFLSVAMSVALVTGLVPAPALAEGLEEVLADEQPVAITLDDGSITVLPSEEEQPSLDIEVPKEASDPKAEMPALEQEQEQNGEKVTVKAEADASSEDTLLVAEAEGNDSNVWEFAYGEKRNILVGYYSVELTDVLASLGLTGDLTAVEVSNPAFFSASDESGKWIVARHQPFGTEEWIKVTIGGVEYKIVVLNYMGDVYSGYIGLDGEFEPQVAPLLRSNAGALTNRWYLVWDAKNYGETYIENLTIPENASSVVNIILGDGAVLNTNGITIADGKTLRIWAQRGDGERGPGTLSTSTYGIRVLEGRTLEINGGIINASTNTNENNSAGIGGNNNNSAGTITINGGKVIAYGSDNGAGIGGGKSGGGGNISINGGTVNAIAGSRGAGIGGGSGGASGTIRITGGEVHATGGDGAAGIGGGFGIGGGTIDIIGGEVEATGGSKGAGIGGGNNGAGGSITIKGETTESGYSTVVKATGGVDGAGIGGGNAKNSGNITIAGAYVEANGVSHAAGIGGGGNAIANTITIQKSSQGSPAYVVAVGDFGAGIGTGASALLSETSVPVVGGTIDISNSYVTATSVLGGAGIGGGIFGHVDKISISGGQTAAQGGLTVAPKVMPWLYILQNGGAAGLGSKGDVAGDIAGHSIPNGVLDGGVDNLSWSIDQAHIKLWEVLSGTFTGGKKMIFYTGAGIGGGYHAPGGTINISDDAVVQATAGVLPPNSYLKDEITVGEANVTYADPDRTHPSHAIGSGAMDTSSPSVTMYDDALVMTAQVELNASLRQGVNSIERTYKATASDKATSDANVSNPDMDNKTGAELATESSFALIKPVPIVNIVFDANDGAGTATRSMQAQQGKEVTLDKNEFTRTNYNFVEWNTKADGTGTSYADEASFTAPDEDLTLYAQWEEVPAAQGPQLMSHSLTLSGAIGLDYFMSLDSLSEDELAGCRMEFSVGRGAKKTTHVATLNPTFRDVGGAGYYGFSCPTTSIQMADAIEATFFWGDESMKLPDYSVEAYVGDFDVYQAEHPGAFDENTVALVHAVADYGHFSQPYLSRENNWAVGTDYAEMGTFYTNSYVDDLADVRSALAAHAVSKGISGTPVASATMRLYLDSGTSVEALLSPAEAASFSAADVKAVTGSFSGRKPVVRLLADGRISVRVDGVSAHLLATPLVVSYEGHEILRLSALSFVDNSLAGSPDAVTRDAMCALYKYYEAAIAYAKASDA